MSTKHTRKHTQTYTKAKSPYPCTQYVPTQAKMHPTTAGITNLYSSNAACNTKPSCSIVIHLYSIMRADNNKISHCCQHLHFCTSKASTFVLVRDRLHSRP